MRLLRLICRAPSKEHFPVWVKMRSHMRQNKSFGIFHETFKVRAKLVHWSETLRGGCDAAT